MNIFDSFSPTQDFWDSTTDFVLGRERISNRTLRKDEREIMLGVSIGISIIGSISNLLSLSYFVALGSNKLGEGLLALLNLLDFLVCICATLMTLVIKYATIPPLPWYFTTSQALYSIFLENTGFATVLLSVVRTIASYFPFYEIKRKLIHISFVIFFAHTFVKGALIVYFTLNPDRGLLPFIQTYNIFLLVSLNLNVSVVLIANCLAIYKLLQNKRHHASIPTSVSAGRHATVTILILSALFCLLNLVYIVVLANAVLGYETISMLFRNVIVTGAIPLNSALNPFVYFSRKKEMRRFLCVDRCRVLDTTTCPDVVFSLSTGTSNPYAFGNACQLQSPSGQTGRSIDSISRDNHETSDL